MDEFKKDLEDYFCRFTFGQFVTLILIEIVTLFFVFYLGARYGPDLLGGGNVAKKEESLLPKQGPGSVDEIVGSPSVEYTYPDVLTNEDGQKGIRVKPSGVTADEYDKRRVREQVQPPAKLEVPRKVESATPRPSPAGDEEPTGEAPKAAAKAEAPKEAPVRSDKAPKGKFSVQVGSYQSTSEATASLNEWKKKGYEAFMAVGQVPQKGIWYRVRIGGFETRGEAERFLEKLKNKEKVSALVVLSNG